MSVIDSTIYCERCGAAIPFGWPVARYHTEDGWVVMHRFSTQCNPDGVKFVEELNKKFGEFKNDPAD